MNTRMQFLEHELALNEREQQKKSPVQAPASVNIPTAPAPANSDRISNLEHKVHELEALVKGLTEELLDLKTITRKLASVVEKSGGNSPSPAPSRAAVRRPLPEQPREFAAPAPAVGRAVPQPAAQPAEKRTFSAPGAHMPPREMPQAAAAPQPSRIRAQPAAAPAPAPAAAEPAEDSVPLKQGEYEFVMQPDGTILKRPKKTQGSVIIAGTGYGKGRLSRSSAIRAESDAVIEAEEDDTVEIK